MALLALWAAAVGSSGAGEVEDPDHELVKAVLDGDSDAFRGLVERYEGRVYAVVYGMVRNQEDARDLAQEAFVKAYRNLSRFRLESRFYTWLYRIAYNVTIDHIRRQKVRRAEAFEEGVAVRGTGGQLNPGHHTDSPGKSLERKRLKARLLEALDELTDDHRQIIVLRELEGMSYREISDVMGIPEGTVMSRLYYARKKLQVSLKDEVE
jgi:RNA polymerase sigma-70 factor (ECF subfamily)